MDLTNLERAETSFREVQNENNFKNLCKVFVTTIGSKVASDAAEKEYENTSPEEIKRQNEEYEKKQQEWEKEYETQKKIRDILQSDSDCLSHLEDYNLTDCSHGETSWGSLLPYLDGMTSG